MINSTLITISNIYGCKLKERIYNNSFRYDGKTIATKGKGLLLTIFDDFDELDNDKEPIRNLTDHEILHEIAHFIAADETQRKTPEFGLLKIFKCKDYNPNNIDFHSYNGYVDWTEQLVQEFFAQKISSFLGKKYSLHPDLFDYKYKDWDDYDQVKEIENRNFLSSLSYKEALHRFKYWIKNE